MVIILFSSCDFEFSEDYYKEIDVSEPNISFSLSNFTDGETLRKPKDIYFNYQASNRNSLYQIDFYVDDNFIESFTNTSDTFFLDITNLSNENHRLRVEYFFKTSSGSLAEITGNEAYHIIEEFTFSVDKNALPVTINRVENKEGSIFIYFDDYEEIDEIDKSLTITLNIQTISRPYGNGNFYEFGYSDEVLLTKEDLENGFFKDISSTGLLIEYSTKVQNYYSELVSEPTKIDLYDLFKVTAKQENLEKIILTWNQHPLYNNINTIVFSYPTKGTNHNFALPSINGGNLEIDNEMYFGGLRYLNLYFYSKNPRNGYYNPYYSYLYTIGEKIPNINFDKLVYNSKTNKIYTLEIKKDNDYPSLDDVYIHVLNATNLTPENGFLLTTTKSEFGEISVDNNGDVIVDLNSKSIVIDANSNTIKQEYLGSTFSNNISYSTKVKYRNNMVYIDENTNSTSYNNVKIFDAITKNLILEKEKKYTNKITNNGKFISFKDKIYIKNSGTYEEFYTTYDNAEIVDLLLIESKNKLYFVANYNCYELDLTTKLVSPVQVHGHVVSVRYNSFQDKLLFAIQYGSTFISLDLQTLETKQIRGYYNYEVAFVNNFLIMQGGYYLKDVL
jgi:hypothetical protein